MFVNNYTGDRLNFGMAVERVKAENKDYEVEMVIIDDDVALEDKLDFTTGGRGLAGSTLMFQVNLRLEDYSLICLDGLYSIRAKDGAPKIGTRMS